MSANINDFALIAMLGLLALPIFGACGANVDNLGYRVLKIHDKSDKTVLTSLPTSGGPRSTAL